MIYVLDEHPGRSSYEDGCAGFFCKKSLRLEWSGSIMTLPLFWRGQIGLSISFWFLVSVRYSRFCENFVLFDW